MRLAVIYALACIVPSSVKADECRDVLSYGYNRDYSSGSYSSTQALKNSICSHAEKASDHGSKAGISIPGVGSLDFGSSSDSRETQGWCHTTSSDTSIDLKYNNAVERVNDIVIKKWDECMSLSGPKATLSLNADGRSVIATLAYIQAKAVDVGAYRGLATSLSLNRIKLLAVHASYAVGMHHI
jgi:hypothetical protein